jgi:hypothetical protein
MYPNNLQVHVWDDFLPEKLFKEIADVALGNEFEWYYQGKTSRTVEEGGNITVTITNEHTVDSPQFTHSLYFKFDGPTSKYFEWADKIGMAVQEKTGITFDNHLRSKLNMIMPNPLYKDGDYHVPHADWTTEEFKHEDYELWSCILYLNDSDGDTFIFDNHANDVFDIRAGKKELTLHKRISPKANRLVFFTSDFLHASSTPTKDRRVIINTCMTHKKEVLI